MTHHSAVLINQVMYNQKKQSLKPCEELKIKGTPISQFVLN